MSRFEIVCVVMLAISGVIGLVGSRFIVEQQRVIDTTRAENDSLRAECDSLRTEWLNAKMEAVLAQGSGAFYVPPVAYGKAQP